MLLLGFAHAASDSLDALNGTSNLLMGFRRLAAREFVPDYAWGGTTSGFQRCYAARVTASRVVAAMKRELEPQLWDFSPYMDSSGARMTRASGKEGSIYKDWCVCIYWDVRDPGSLITSDVDLAPTIQRGWTGISVYAPCQRAELACVIELFRYTFGVR